MGVPMISSELPSLKQTVNARENRPAQKETSIQQPSIFLDVLKVVEKKTRQYSPHGVLMVIYHGRK